MTKHEESLGPIVKDMKLRFASMVYFVTLWLLAVMACAVHAQDFNYTTNNGEITITKYIGPWGAAVAIPETIDGLPVTRIGESAFATGELMQDFHSPSSVKIPNSVISIGEGAFEHRQGLTNITIPPSITNLPARLCHGCRHLTTITIPNSVTSIGDQAFESCADLDNPNIPDSVRHVGSRAFAYCDSLATILIPNSVTTFGDSVFAYCAVLKNVTLSDKLSNLPVGLFQGCSSLTSIIIPQNVSAIGSLAFFQCGNLSCAVIPPGVVSIGDSVFEGCTNLANVNISINVTNIAAQAFKNCSRLACVTLPEGVQALGCEAFYGCLSMSSITIPDSVTCIGNGVFDGCANLAFIKVGTNNNAYSDLDGVLFDKPRFTLIRFPPGKGGNYIIPDGVKTLGGCAFRDCNNIQHITIPKSVAAIGDLAFFACYGLTSITIPNSVTMIGLESFECCPNLSCVTLPNSITNIGSFAFIGCRKLRRINYEGNAPTVGVALFQCFGPDWTTMYYLPGSTGWGNTFCDRPTALWLPQMETRLDTGTNQFGFSINWARGRNVVIEACTNLASPVWVPLQTNTLAEDTSFFTDPKLTNTPSRFYRLRAQ